MTAEAFAELVEARRTGGGKWQARCPAHRDHSPSLSIRDMGDKVLFHCFAGCPPDAILAALGLSWSDLLKPLSPEQRRQAAAQREQRDALEREARSRRREAWDRVRKWTAIIEALGDKLARTPDDAPDGDSLTRLFQAACDRLHAAEIEAERMSRR